MQMDEGKMRYESVAYFERRRGINLQGKSKTKSKNTRRKELVKKVTTLQYDEEACELSKPQEHLDPLR